MHVTIRVIWVPRTPFSDIAPPISGPERNTREMSARRSSAAKVTSTTEVMKVRVNWEIDRRIGWSLYEREAGGKEGGSREGEWAGASGVCPSPNAPWEGSQVMNTSTN